MGVLCYQALEILMAENSTQMETQCISLYSIPKTIFVSWFVIQKWSIILTQHSFLLVGNPLSKDGDALDLIFAKENVV